MKKKIFHNMILLASCCILILGTMLCLIFYTQLRQSIRQEIKSRAFQIAALPEEERNAQLYALQSVDLRVSLIGSDGTVIFDNATEEAILENHLSRTEIQAALANGSGESSRLSKTLGSQTFYYAVALSDGSILRLAKTADSIFSIFARSIPAILLIVCLMMALSYIASNRLAKRIVAPINQLDFENPQAVYDELAPFVRTIRAQRGKIQEDYEMLRTRQETINTLMESMYEGAVLINQDETLLYVNQSAANLFDTSLGLQDHDLRELIRDLEIVALAQRALTGARETLDKRIGEQAYRIFASPVKEVGVILLFVDVTQSVEAEQQRREFTANVSHELRTPLTILSGYAQILMNGIAKEEDIPGFVRKIKDESDRLMNLIEDILLLSGLDEGKVDSSREEVDLSEVAEQVRELLKEKARQNDIQIDIFVRGIPLLYANPSHMQELLMNIMDNAVKYNRQGGRVEVSIERLEENLLLQIHDTGIGIEPAKQARVFERFYRVDPSRSKRSGGTGLGLAIAKHICLLYGATITLESLPGEGTTIQVKFV
ncbi:MAG: hypothetical protein LBM60_09725 [Clostridium sp.]|nr:hypothetical protein [Clostridium sp.]